MLISHFPTHICIERSRGNHTPQFVKQKKNIKHGFAMLKKKKKNALPSTHFLKIFTPEGAPL